MQHPRKIKEYCQNMEKLLSVDSQSDVTKDDTINQSALSNMSLLNKNKTFTKHDKFEEEK
jgi:hypothetical protein